MFKGFPSNISNDIKINFSRLSNEDKQNLIKFIARLTELSYRRGFEQCDSISDDMDLDSLRPLIDNDVNSVHDEVSDKISIDVLIAEYNDSFENIGLSLKK